MIDAPRADNFSSAARTTSGSSFPSCAISAATSASTGCVAGVALADSEAETSVDGPVDASVVAGTVVSCAPAATTSDPSSVAVKPIRQHRDRIDMNRLRMNSLLLLPELSRIADAKPIGKPVYIFSAVSHGDSWLPHPKMTT